MRRVAAIASVVALAVTGLQTIVGAPGAQAAPGDVDTSFGYSGSIQTASTGWGFQGGVAVADHLGNILIGGSDTSAGSTGRDSVVARLTSNGQPDDNFGNGEAGIEFDAFTNSQDDRVTGIAENPATGEIYVASTWGPGGSDSAGYTRVARYNADGTGPTVRRDFGPGKTEGQLAFVGNRLTMATTLARAGGFDFDGVFVAAMNPDLTPDTTFGDGTGDLVASRALRTVFQALAVDSTNHAFLGAHQGAGTSGAQLFKLNVDGTPDISFGGDGHILVRPTGDDWITSIAPNADGRIAVAGPTFSGANSHVSLVDAAGNFISTFDGDGMRTLPNRAWSVAWDDAGRLVYAQEGDGVAGRLLATGANDTSFSGDGVSSVSCGGGRAPSLIVNPARIVVAGDCGGYMFAAGFQNHVGVSNLTYTLSPSTAAAGREQVDLTTLSLSDLRYSLGNITSAPLRASPLRASPLRASPLRSSPLRASPLRASPLRASPLRGSPLRASPLPVTVPLSTIPLIQETAADPSWTDILIGTPYANLPLQSVTLQQVLAATDTVPLTVDNVTLGAVDLSSSPLRASTLTATFLWGVPLSGLPVPYPSWCEFLTDNGLPATTTCDATFLAQHDLLDLELMGLSMSNYYSGYVSLIDVNLRGNPAVPNSGSPLGKVLVRDFNFANSNLGGIQASAAPTIVSCGACGGGTIAEAQKAGYTNIRDTATLADVIDLVPSAQPGPFDVTLADVLTGLIDVADLPFDDIGLYDLLNQAVLRTTGNVTHTLTYDHDCAVSGTPNITTDLPGDARPVPGTTRLAIGAGPANLVDDPNFSPEGEGPAYLDFGLGNVCGASTSVLHLKLTFDVEPGSQLDSYWSRAEVSVGGASQSVDATPGATVDKKDATDDNPATPTPLSVDKLYTGHISHPGDIDNYHVGGVPAGSTVSVIMSHLPADFDLVMYGSEADVPSSPLRASPLRASPLRASPVGDGVDTGTDPATAAPEGLADVPLRASPLRASSLNRSDATESVSTIARSADSAGFDIQVSGFNGASSNQPYLLQVKVTPGPAPMPCMTRRYGTTGVAGTAPAPASVPAATESLILVNQKRMGDIYGAAAVSPMMTSINAMAAKSTVRGVVLPVESSAAVQSAYAAWDAAPCSPEAANNVVSAINTLVDSYRSALPNLRHIAIVGNDEVIPQGRISDLTSVSNQMDYTEMARIDDTDNPISAAFLNGYILSDEPFGDFDPQPWLNGRFYVSDVGLGRVIETPAEVKDIVDRYNNDADGALAPTTGFVTGYDFLADGAAKILTAVKTRAPNAGSQINSSWTAQQALTGIQQPNSLTSVNAHYDHYQALPGLPFSQNSTADLLHTGQLDTAHRLDQSVLFTIGCEAGLNVPDVLVAGSLPVGATPSTAQSASAADWAQRTGQLGGSFTGNTGYGYGDTDSVAYSERLYQYFAENVAGGTMSLGQALMFAKQRFNGELGVAGVYDAKSLEEATTYGLPFWRTVPGGGLGAPALPTPPAAPPTVINSTIAFDSGAIVNTATNGQHGQFWTANGQTPQVTHGRPIQPRITIEQTPPAGQRAHGVVIDSLTSTDVNNVDPSIATPTIDLSANEPEAGTTSSVFPSSLQAISHIPTPAGERDELVLMPGQFLANEDDPSGHGTQRLFSNIKGTVFRSNSTDFDAPQVRSVIATELVNAVRIDVATPSTDAVAAKALFRYGNDAGGVDPVWRAVDLTAVPGGFSFTVTPTTGMNKVVDLRVQIRDAAGNVGLSSNKGPGYRSEVNYDNGAAPTLVASPGIPTSGFTAGSPTFTLEGGGLYEVQDNGGPWTAYTGPFTVATEGPHSLVARAAGSDATTAPVQFTNDVTPPSITITAPVDNASYAQGSVPAAAFTCTDTAAGSGIGPGGCVAAAPLDTTLGAHTFTVNATDRSGRTASKSVRYTVTAASFTFEGFFSPVDNLPTVNTAKRGSNVPVKFRIRNAAGALVVDPSQVQVLISDASCAANAPADAVEVYTTDPDGVLKWDGSQFQFNYKTEKTAGLCKRVTFRYNGGSQSSSLLIRTT
jgi:hypothetical protein